MRTTLGSSSRAEDSERLRAKNSIKSRASLAEETMPCPLPGSSLSVCSVSEGFGGAGLSSKACEDGERWRGCHRASMSSNKRRGVSGAVCSSVSPHTTRSGVRLPSTRRSARGEPSVTGNPHQLTTPPRRPASAPCSRRCSHLNCRCVQASPTQQIPLAQIQK